MIDDHPSKLEPLREFLCKAPLPTFISPQLATLVKEPPSGEKWLHQLKFDGYRMLCRIDRGEVQFWSRNEKDWTEKFPGLVEAVRSLPIIIAILDGEIVVVDAQGRSSFQKLQRSMGEFSRPTSPLAAVPKILDFAKRIGPSPN